MSEHPLVSIIVPSYNTADYISKCLNSLLDQTLKAIEVICIDDASTDATWEILQSYQMKDNRLKIFQQRKNLGQSCARNRALKLAKGDYIMFCDSDDYYSKNMCEVLYNSIVKQKVDLVESGVDIIYQAVKHLQKDDDEIYRLKYKGKQKVDDELIYQTSCMTPTKIFRRNIIKHYNIDFPEHLRYEDAYFTRAYLSFCKEVYFIEDKFYHYIRRAGSTMSVTWTKKAEEDFAIDHIKVMIELYDFWTSHNKIKTWKNLFWRLFGLYIQIALDSAKTLASQREIYQMSKNFTKEHLDQIRDLNINARNSIIRCFPSIYFFNNI